MYLLRLVAFLREHFPKLSHFPRHFSIGDGPQCECHLCLILVAPDILLNTSLVAILIPTGYHTFARACHKCDTIASKDKKSRGELVS